MKSKKGKKKKPVLVGAYDPILGMRTLYVVKEGIAKSLATGHTFKIDLKKLFKAKNG